MGLSPSTLHQSTTEHRNMKSLVLVGLVTAVHGATRMLDEEEFLHAQQFKDEALDVERGVARMALEAGEGYHYVEPAPPSAGRHLGLGLGVQLGPFGAGASAGVGNGGVGFNSNLGYGHNYLSYGSPDHYKQYYTSPVSQIRMPGSRTLGLGPFPTVPQIQYVPVSSRTLGLGAGIHVGPIGAGASAGVGHGQVGLSAGLGWGNYQDYGAPAHYHQYYSQPYTGPWYHSGKLV